MIYVSGGLPHGSPTLCTRDRSQQTSTRMGGEDSTHTSVRGKSCEGYKFISAMHYYVLPSLNKDYLSVYKVSLY